MLFPDVLLIIRRYLIIAIPYYSPKVMFLCTFVSYCAIHILADKDKIKSFFNALNIEKQLNYKNWRKKVR